MKLTSLQPTPLHLFRNREEAIALKQLVKQRYAPRLLYPDPTPS
jgi:hypothetical protein